MYRFKYTFDVVKLLMLTFAVNVIFILSFFNLHPNNLSTTVNMSLSVAINLQSIICRSKRIFVSLQLLVLKKFVSAWRFIG